MRFNALLVFVAVVVMFVSESRSEPVIGDFNGNDRRDVDDVDLLTDAMHTPYDQAFDLNGDGSVDFSDRTTWIVELSNTFLGDSNFDGEFNSGDLVTIFKAAKYETGEVATWAEGDWNGDYVFSSSDFVCAFGCGAYEIGPRDGGLMVVPEPAFQSLLVMLGLAVVRRRLHSQSE